MMADAPQRPPGSPRFLLFAVVLAGLLVLAAGALLALMYRDSPSTPRAWIAAGVLATGNSLAVALFTPTSVDCADRITAISNSNGDE